MKFGVTIPNNWGLDDPQEVVALAPLAEELGFDSLWVMDHLFNAGYIGERLGDRPYYHPLSVLSYVAATTTRIALGTSVLVLPYHNPVQLAKYAATLDQLSGGRLVLGLGAGGSEDEFRALGISLRDRRVLTDEGIAVMKELWTSPDPRFESDRWRFSDLKFSPKPAQRPHPPLWIGGSSTGALRRAATLGDGWHPLGMTPERFAEGRRELEDLARAARRDPASLTMSVRVNVDFGPGGRGQGNAMVLPAGDATGIAAGVEAFRDAGVEHVVLALDSGDAVRLRAEMEEIAANVIPRFR